MPKPLRLFLASPGDVTEEGHRVQHVIDQLNRSRLLKEFDLILELLRKETHARPEMGRPQELILRQLASATWDVFIGILWLKFGTPTGTANPDTQLPYLSGTEEEFRAAYKRWCDNPSKWPRIMFYRCKRTPDDIDTIDLEQLAAVRAFFKDFSPNGAHPGLIQEYTAPEEFEDLLYNHLQEVLYEFRDSQIETTQVESQQLTDTLSSQPLAELYISDIMWSERDQTAIEYFMSMYAKDHREPLTNDNILNWLQRWLLVKSVAGNDYFTRAGAILFGPQDRLSTQTDIFVSYHGKRAELVRLEGMCLLRLAQELLRELTSLWTRSWEEPDKRDQTGKPIEFHPYPQTALVEAAVNLIIHRDYTSTEKAYVDIYDDKVVFANPGSSQHSVEALLAADELERQPYARNNLIINTFSRTGLNQTQRRGIRRIRDSLQANQSQGPDAGLPLKIVSSEENNTFKLTIFAAKPPEISASQVSTTGSDYIKGDVVSGGRDFIGRDRTISVMNDPTLDLAGFRNQRNLTALRKIVRSAWIDGVLKHSLYQEVLIHINLETRPELVKRPWDIVLLRPDLPSESLSPNTAIIDIFDQMNQNLLILGEPGSGKTTMLLELADALLNRAEQNPTQPTPVVFALSSWAIRQQSLAKWLITELREKYRIPLKIAQDWIMNDELIPLLDALDEVQSNARQACVTAINEFRQEHLVPIVVASRKATYENIATELQFQGAIMLQPLSEEQVSDYLYQIGADSEFIDWVKGQDSVRGLLTSPLFLSILTMSIGRTDRPLIDGEESARLLFDTYIQTMFKHRQSAHPYTQEQMIRWLRQLAITMIERNQPIFGMKRGLNGWYQQLISWSSGNTPLNLKQFLEYATDLLFLRRVGDGYIFVHRLLMEHFASLTDDDIVRITSKLD